MRGSYSIDSSYLSGVQGLAFRGQGFVRRHGCGGRAIIAGREGIMRLFRVVVPILVAGILPCVAQSPTPKHPAESAPAKTQSSPQLKLQKLTVIEKSSTCYSIREYRFAVPKDSRVPKLKSYSTCV